jgi:hypothetical protein
MAMQSARSGAYLAGLWNGSLVLDMLWGADSDYKPLRPPSWSCGLGIGKVYYGYLNNDVVIEAEVKGFHCQPEGVSQTGKISSGWIQLKSSMIECLLQANGRYAFAGQGGWTKMRKARITLIFNCQNELRESENPFFMVQMVTRHNPSGWSDTEEMLLVEPVGI